jgi:hypothetical protein
MLDRLICLPGNSIGNYSDFALQGLCPEVGRNSCPVRQSNSWTTKRRPADLSSRSLVKSISDPSPAVAGPQSGTFANPATALRGGRVGLADAVPALATPAEGPDRTIPEATKITTTAATASPTKRRQVPADVRRASLLRPRRQAIGGTLVPQFWTGVGKAGRTTSARGNEDNEIDHCNDVFFEAELRQRIGEKRIRHKKTRTNSSAMIAPILRSAAVIPPVLARNTALSHHRGMPGLVPVRLGHSPRQTSTLALGVSPDRQSGRS